MDPYSNAKHAERSTYRCGSLRITYQTEGYAANKRKPWMCVRNGTVTTLCGETAIEAMHLLGNGNPAAWEHTP